MTTDTHLMRNSLLGQVGDFFVNKADTTLVPCRGRPQSLGWSASYSLGVRSTPHVYI